VIVEWLQEFRQLPKFSRERKRSAEVTSGVVEGKKVILCKPLLFMNKSGGPILQIAQFYKINAENLIIIHDEIDISVASIKRKSGGGHAGHN
jgi:PTH1 family peptidyl-tRNA hydrolase